MTSGHCNEVCYRIFTEMLQLIITRRAHLVKQSNSSSSAMGNKTTVAKSHNLKSFIFAEGAFAIRVNPIRTPAYEGATYVSI